jgi:hypothetical protein
MIVGMAKIVTKKERVTLKRIVYMVGEHSKWFKKEIR